LIKFGKGVAWALFHDHHRRIWASIHVSIAWGNQEISRVSDLVQKPPNLNGHNSIENNARMQLQLPYNMILVHN
jgi:hypothetical protein